MNVTAPGSGLFDVAEGFPERPAAVVECFVHCVEAGEVTTAIGLLSEGIISSVGPRRLETIFTASVLEIGEAGGIDDVEVQTLAFSRDHVEMLLTIWYGDHQVERETVEVVREGGGWKISLSEAKLDAMRHTVSSLQAS